MSQNINQFPKPNWGIKLGLESNDMSLVSDERNFNEEVVFSPYLIAQTYGNRLPFYFDINDSSSVQQYSLNYKHYNFNNVFVSKNYYNPDNLDLSCLTANTSCDIGLTGIDNGLVTSMTGQTITFTNGINDFTKFDRLSFDRRFKMFQVTGYTSSNIRFTGFNRTILYEVVSQYDLISQTNIHQLYGGFYQGFYRLFGYDYEIFPERMNKGWSVEMLLKPRFPENDDYTPLSGETTLNVVYPQNKNIFFYMGTRAENKFYHHADGFMGGISAYTRVTSELVGLETCACCNTGVTDSRCIYVYPPRSMDGGYDPHHNYGCNTCGCNSSSYVCSSCGCPTFENDICGWECKNHTCESSVQSTCETDPLFDSMSNAISFKLCGDPHNPSIGVKVLRFTGDCVTTGSCETSGITYQTGYTITEYCSPIRIYDYCDNINPAYLEEEHWFQLDAVWERYTWLDTCDLWYRGGLGDITERKLLESLANNTMSLIAPPYTQIGYPAPGEVELVNLNEKWLIDKDFRKGRLKIYINGRRFFTIENFEEIIPRALNTDKEKQVGVPFNISWGGGTQGLRENLTFSSTTGTTYIQDPESLPTNDLVGTFYSGLTTDILLEQNFGGTFEGGISQFRMYVTPLSAPEIKHNFKLLKDTFNMFNPDCPDCGEEFCPVDDITYEITIPYSFEGCCDTSNVFNLDNSPSNLSLGQTYLLITDSFTGCSTVITYNSSYPIFQYIESINYSDCLECEMEIPCNTIYSFESCCDALIKFNVLGISNNLSLGSVLYLETDSFTGCSTVIVSQPTAPVYNVIENVEHTDCIECEIEHPCNTYYSFESCCNSLNVFNLDNYPENITLGQTYFLETNSFTGCSTVIIYQESLPIYNSLVTEYHNDCLGCEIEHPCV